MASCLKGIIFNPINFAVFIFFFIWNDKSFICYISQHAMLFCLNSIGGVIVSMFASNAVDCGFESRSGQTKDYIIGICCFSAKHTVLRKKSKDWLARNQDNVCLSWFFCPSTWIRLCSYSLKLMLRALRRSNKYQLYSLWFDTTGTRIHDLPHSRRAC